MAGAERRTFVQPDQVQEFPLARLETVNLGGVVVGRATLQPGWRWSTSIQPVAQTGSCQSAHFQYHVSGVLKVVMDDGTELECGAGDVSWLPPGHDAWVLGDEPVVVVDFRGMADWARPR